MYFILFSKDDETGKGAIGKTKIFKEAMSFVMAIGVVEFSIGGTETERFLPKNQHTQRKLLNFENWVNGEVSKSAKI